MLLVTLDTVRADHLSCYGYKKKTTPFIDELARNGTLFENAIATAPTTPVSHASILTGLYPPHNGLRYIHGHSHHALDPSVPTAAEIFKSNGYATAAFISAFPLKSSRYGLSRGFDHFDEAFLQGRGDPAGKRGFVLTGDSQRRADEALASFFSWLDSTNPKSFFAWVHLFDVHDKRLLPPDDYHRAYVKANKGEAPQSRIELYDYELTYIDHQLSRAIGRLQRRCSSLVVVIVADHGEGLGDHNYQAHGDRLFQEQTRVPLVIYGTDVSWGRRIKQTVSAAGVMPTMLSLARLPVPEGLDGTNLMDVNADQSCYAETLNPMIRARPPLFALVRGPQKIIMTHGIQDIDGYDLAADPRELSASSALAGELPAMLEQLKALAVVPEDAEAELMDEGTRESLKSLGYLD